VSEERWVTIRGARVRLGEDGTPQFASMKGSGTVPPKNLPVDNIPVNTPLKLYDWRGGQKVDTGRFIKGGTEITNLVITHGPNVSRALIDGKWLTKDHPGDGLTGGWSKYAGKAIIIDRNGNERIGEVHFYMNNNSTNIRRLKEKL